MKTLYYGGVILFVTSTCCVCFSTDHDVRLLTFCVGMIGGIAMHHVGVVLLNRRARST